MTRHPVTFISFGYRHMTGAPPAERLDDVRASLRDPARAKGILDRTGLEPEVQQIVLDTPGARELLAEMVDSALKMRESRPRRLAVGCEGGRHRSVALAELAAIEVRNRGLVAVVRHLHVHLPRILKPTDGGQR